jgi:hypothetical protein
MGVTFEDRSREELGSGSPAKSTKRERAAALPVAGCLCRPEAIPPFPLVTVTLENGAYIVDFRP